MIPLSRLLPCERAVLDLERAVRDQGKQIGMIAQQARELRIETATDKVPVQPGGAPVLHQVQVFHACDRTPLDGATVTWYSDNRVTPVGSATTDADGMAAYIAWDVSEAPLTLSVSCPSHYGDVAIYSYDPFLTDPSYVQDFVQIFAVPGTDSDGVSWLCASPYTIRNAPWTLDAQGMTGVPFPLVLVGAAGNQALYHYASITSGGFTNNYYALPSNLGIFITENALTNNDPRTSSPSAIFYPPTSPIPYDNSGVFTYAASKILIGGTYFSSGSFNLNVPIA